MSLIQEALRRKDDDENGAKLTPPPRVIPPAYDVPPVLKIPEKRKSGAKNWTVLIFSLALILALILVALGLLVHSTRQIMQTATMGPEPSMHTDMVDEKVLREDVPPRVVQPPVAVVLEEPVTAPARRMDRVQDVTPAVSPRVDADSVTPRVTPAPPPVVAVPTRPAVQPAPAPAAPRRPPVITEIPRKTLEGVRTVPAAVTGTGTSVWPRLSLHGVMAQTGPGQGSAIINGTVVEVGERIDGARLVEVQRNGVSLEFRGNTQFVRVGQSTF